MKPASFEDIISFESLLEAHKRARRSKQHKKEVIEFEAHLSRNLWALHYELKYRKYAVGEYRKFMIYDPKEREIQAIPYRDRIVQHSVCDNLLIPLLERYLIDANCACRIGKGNDHAIKLLRSFMADHYKKHGCKGCFIKLDIKKYFPSIDHSVLYEKLEKFGFDGGANWLLHVIIDSYGGGLGLPMGNQSSQCFALLYLDRIDRIIKEKLRVKFYVRYMDDMILLLPDKKKAGLCFSLLSDEIKKERLVLNPKSTISGVKNGIEFLGWRFRFADSGKIVQKLKKASKQRIFEKVRFAKYLFIAGRKSFDDMTSSAASYRGHFLRGDAWNVYCRVRKILSV
ncbi:MAG: RNA-directed DNA polymerase [Treponema sp.]|nr:RNA-directed DNA polymerase [Treponema sp.]